MEEMLEQKAIVELLNDFLKGLSLEARRIFMQRYWYMYSIQDISEEFRMSESKVKMSLHRTRKKLKQLLEKEGVYL